MVIFPDTLWQLTLIWPNFDLFRDVIDVLVTCKNKEDPIKNEDASLRVFITFSPIITYRSYPLPWKPEFPSDLARNIMQPFPHPIDHTIDSKSVKIQ